MMDFLYKKPFLKKFASCDANSQKLIVLAENEIQRYYIFKIASFGLRIKKLYDNGKEKVYEARVSDKIRIVWIESKNLVVFSLLGNHNEIHRYLKNFYYFKSRKYYF